MRRLLKRQGAAGVDSPREMVGAGMPGESGGRTPASLGAAGRPNATPSVRGDTRVCVVGGGAAGQLLALLLAKGGADVLVLEAHETFDRELQGEVPQPSTARRLDALGLLD